MLKGDDYCSEPCEGDASSSCGKTGEAATYSIYVATCPSGWIRFGEHCYKKNANTGSIEKNEDFCAGMVCNLG